MKLRLLISFYIVFLVYACGDNPQKKTEEQAILNFNKAMLLVDEGKYNEALNYINNAIKLKPEDELFYFNRAVIKHSIGMYKEAIIDYSKALTLEPKNNQESDRNSDSTNSYIKAETYNYRALSKMKLEDFRGAITDFSEAIKLNPNVAEYYVNHAGALKTLNYLDSACIAWSKAGELGNEGVYELIRKYCN